MVAALLRLMPSAAKGSLKGKIVLLLLAMMSASHRRSIECRFARCFQATLTLAQIISRLRCEAA